ncbi:MAG: hypothetical protein WD603_02540 [Patescibacteria group bacterium]
MSQDVETPFFHSAEELHARYATHLDTVRQRNEGVLEVPSVRMRRCEAATGIRVLNELSEAVDLAVQSGDAASYPEAVATIADGWLEDLDRHSTPDMPLRMTVEAARTALLETHERGVVEQGEPADISADVMVAER